MTFITTQSSGAVDTSETTVTPATLPYLTWNGAAFAPTAAPASEPTELSRDPTAYSSAQQFITLTTGQTVLGVPAVTFEWGGNAFSTMEMATIPAGSATGTYYFALVIDTSTLAGGDQLRLEIEDSTDIAADEWVDVNRGDPTGWIESGNATVNGCRILGTAENSDSRTIQRGTDLHEVIVVVDVSVAPTNDMWIGINAQVNSKSLTAGMLTLRAADYDPDAGGDAAKVKPTGVTGGGVLTLTAASNQVASISADTTLALPAAPGSGVRDIVARVAVTSGTLTLPSSDVAVFGEAGPFSADVRLAIRQYGDGSPADIYAVTEV